MNFDTKLLAGRDSSRTGSSYCSSTPPRPNTATRSASLSASSMSWVTKTMVLCNWLCRRKDLVLQLVTDNRVDGGERLVHQQNRRIGGQGPCHADALLFSAGKLRGIAFCELGVQSYPFEHLVSGFAGEPTRLTLQYRYSCDVVDHPLMRHQPRVLDDVTDPQTQLHRIDGRDILSVDRDGPSRSDRPSG